MRIVLDTNIFLTCISDRSPFYWMFELLTDYRLHLCVSTEILLEYEEVVGNHMGPKIAESAIKTILKLPNTRKTMVYYKWNLLRDEDDNKFVDCSIAANADYLVTQDKHFNNLNQTNFPKVNVISLEDFKIVFEASQNN